jgi:carbamoyl-phosphate synthase large subunit
VHSGDSMAVYPGINLSDEVVDTLIDYTIRIGLALNVNGLMNIQFVVMPDKESGGFSVYILEVNPRSSRTVPFISKVTGVPMVKLATKVMLGISLKEQGYRSGLWKKQGLFAVKVPVFSMSKLTGVDTYLGPEMKSTGEVMGIDYIYDTALAKALQAAGLTLPEKGALLLSIADKDKPEALPVIKKLASVGYTLYATEGTAAMIEAAGIPVKVITKKLDEGHPNVIDVITQGTVNAVLNTITGGRVPLRDGFFIRRAATERRIPCFTSLDTAAAAVDTLVKGSHSFSVNPLPDYRKKENL